MKNTLSSTFNVNPVKYDFTPAVRDDVNATVVTDSAESRSNIKDLLEVGGVALREALSVAIAAEDPKAFEVVATLMSTMADLNSKIMAMHAMEQKLTSLAGITKAVQNNSTTNNIVFSGTTAELSALLSNKETKS
jgi:CheY-like chemotaxis protein